MRVFVLSSSLLALATVIAFETPVAGQRGGPPAEPSVQAASGAQAPPAGNADHGKKIFADYGCYQCHGYVAQGGQAGARLAPRPIPFAAFSRYVRAPRNQMPPYTAKVVSEQELADIYAFLMTIPPPAPVASIPLLNDR